MNARFYVPDAHATGDVVALPDVEAQHLTRVLRLKAGDAVRVFDGRGGEFDAVVEDVTKLSTRVRVGAVRAAAAERRVSVTLAAALLKGDKMDDVVRDAVMMGVAAIQPLVTTRTEVTGAAIARARRLERWTRIAISSAKQCGRARVPVILEPLSIDQLTRALTAMTTAAPGLMLVEPSASSDAIALRDLPLPAPSETTVIVGPEGGWTSEEIDVAASACRLVTLGSLTLRADAMPIVALSALLARWDDL